MFFEKAHDGQMQMFKHPMRFLFFIGTEISAPMALFVNWYSKGHMPPGPIPNMNSNSQAGRLRFISLAVVPASRRRVTFFKFSTLVIFS